jgi:hypothetical protein
MNISASSNSSMDNNEWPPSSLEINTVNIINECEDLQVAGNSDAIVLHVHMAALLYAQDWHAARHLYRRVEQPDLLLGWYKVVAAVLSQDLAAAWQALQQLPTQLPELQSVLPTYLREIAHAFRLACVKQWTQTSPPLYYAQVLGFTSGEEFLAFYHQHAVRPSSKSSSSLMEIVSFLESRTTADALPAVSSAP